MLVLGCAIFGILTGAVAWLILRDRPGWTGQAVAPVVVGAAGVGVALVTAFAGPLFVDWLAEKRAGPALPGPSAAQLEAWCAVLRVAVLERRVRGEGSQLDQMVRQGTVIDLRAEEQSNLARSRVSVQNRTLPWSQVTTEWDRASGRMVILGDPGYGKTIAALTLLKHINSTAGPPKPVAELFPLVEWYHWQAEHPGERLSDWVAALLSTTYPQLPRIIAAALADADLVLPILDGLDEVPEGHRLACKEAIDAHAERSPPFRPFILTCRVREYTDLAPDWVASDRQIRLVGLEADQVLSVLDEQTTGRRGWAVIRDRVAAGDRDLIALFRSPMRLAIALQAFRDDAGELEKLDPEAAEGHLWDRLLTLGSPKFHGAGHEQIRSWLHFLAARMQREGHQRLWLHELYLFAPEQSREFQSFWIRLAVANSLVIGLAFGLASALLLGLAYGAVVALAGGLGAVLIVVLRLDVRPRRSHLAWPGAGALASAVISWLPVGVAVGLEFARTFGVVVGVSLGLIDALLNGLAAALATGAHGRTPSALVTGPWRTRIYAIRKDIRGMLVAGLAVGVPFGVAIGLVSGLRAGLTVGLVAGLVAGSFAGLADFLRAGTTSVSGDPPRRLAGGGVSAVLTAARNVGLVTGLICAVVSGLALGLISLVLFGRAAALAFGLAWAVVMGLNFGLTGGLAPWFYHYWLRRRLARRGLLPRRLKEFLDWCASPNRGWMRVSDAYEFRHRELLEHLATTASRQRLRPDQAPLSPRF